MGEACILCPRNCKANRTAGAAGFCGAPADIRVARASLHMWEEPCISGRRGSGTVFFVGCNLKCVYCQNYAIARGGMSPGPGDNPEKNDPGAADKSTELGMQDMVIGGKSLSVEELADLFLRMEAVGAHNINLVTAGHYVPGVRDALIRAKVQGLGIPVVYNSSGYELPETLRMLDGLVDIYMPDFKYMSPNLAARYSRAPDYPEVAKAALKEMFRQVGRPVFERASEEEFSGINRNHLPDCGNEEPGTDETTSAVLMKRGMLVRYLLLPGCVIDGKRIMKYLYEIWHDDIWISVMNQYTPQPEQLRDFPELNRKVTGREYDSLLDYAIRLGIQNAYMQEGEAARESFIPDFHDPGLLK